MSLQPDGKFLPKVSDYRCNMLAYHLLLWQLFAIFAPQLIKIDIFSILLSQGCSFFFCYFDPAGKCSPTRNNLFKRRRHPEVWPHEKLINKVVVKFSAFFHVN